MEPSFDDRALTMAFVPIKRRMDKDAAAYREKCEKNRENGRLGGRPKKSETEENRTVFEETERFSEKPKKPDTDTDTGTDLSKDLKVIEDRKVVEGSIVVLLSTGKKYVITPERIATLQNTFPEIDVRRELEVMAEVMRTDPAKRRTDTRIEPTILNWLQIARERAIGQDKVAEAKKQDGKKSQKQNTFHNMLKQKYDDAAIERALDLAW